MKRKFAAILGSILAISLASGAFAQDSGNLSAVDPYGNPTAAPTVTFDTNGANTLANSNTQTVSESIPFSSLGATTFDINGGLNVLGVQAPAGINVSLSGASQGLLIFDVTANAGTAKGSYAVQVLLENQDSGQQGTATIYVNVL